MRFSIVFGLSAMILSILTVRAAREAAGMRWVPIALEIWLAACLLALAVVYGLRSAGVCVEELSGRGYYSRVAKALMTPYFVFAGLTLYLSRWFDREGLLNSVVPGLYIGRLPFRSEIGKLRGAGIGAVLNLCWEFPELSGIVREPGLETAYVPILDGSPPFEVQFQDAVGLVMAWRSSGHFVLIHCAQGHGRSATIAAAALLQMGLASDVEQALLMIRAARRFAKPSQEQKAALVRYWTLSKVGKGKDEGSGGQPERAFKRNDT